MRIGYGISARQKHLLGEHDQQTHTPKKYGTGKDITPITKAPVGAKPLAEYMAVVESSPWVDKPFRHRRIPEKYSVGPDASVYVGLENESRLCERNYEMKFDGYVKQSEEAYRTQLADSNVFMRITQGNLEASIKDGQFENTFTSKTTGAGYKANKVSYKTYLQHRKDGEKHALGVDENSIPDERPIYGYWSKSEDGMYDKADTWLGQYGDVVVEFDKTYIADELTFTDSDSLDYSTRVRSSDWRKPSILSSYGITNGSYMIDIANRGPDYGVPWEAQIYNKSTRAIKHVYSKKPLSDTLHALLRERGIPWSIKS